MQVEDDMKTLFSTLFAAVLLLPFGAQAAGDTISGRTLQEHNVACVSKCSENKPQRYCQKVCECVTNDMSANWSAKDYNDRATMLEQSPDDITVSDEFSKLAKTCAQRIQNAGQ